MMKNIFRFCFSMFFYWAISVNAIAQKNEIVPTKADTAKLYNGFLIGTDLLNPIAGAFGNEYSSYEVDLEAGISGKFFPVLELGMSKSELTDGFGTTFKGNISPYGRIGMNYAMTRSVGSMAYIGGRMGYSKFDYNIYDMLISNGYWAEEISTNLTNEKSQAVWSEFVGGLRVSMSKHLFMGWNVRIKFLNNVKETESSSPAYIPGFGKNKNTTYGIHYTVYYKF